MNKPTLRRLLLVGFFLVSCLVLHAETPLVSKTFPYGSATVEELKEALPQVLSPRGKMIFVEATRKVVVQDEPDNVEAAGAIIAELSKVPANARNVRIEVTLQEIGGTRERSVSTRGTIHVDPIEKNGLQISGTDQSRGSDRMVSQFLLVQSGRSATLQVGEEIPMVDYFYNFAIEGGYIQPGAVRWQNIGSRLSVLPRIVGNQIEITVTPEITTLVDAREQIVSFTKLATTITVADGGTMQLGGFDGASAEFNKGFFSRGSRSTARVGSFTLKAFIETVGKENESSR
ncbi:MAG: hypothetical protein B9S32_15605 [Verrucomicrobia bacterium Tous-C9LFEB]|nr:MAG: hypothetical protein B9S32_15605 [Verrucomicrobia bacterium Tous-C9LFEB]